MATYASEPQRRVRDFCVSFRTCRSWDELWILRAEKSETQQLPPQCRHAHSFRILSRNSASWPPLFFTILLHKFVQVLDTLKIPVRCFGTRDTLKKVTCLILSYTLFLLLCHFIWIWTYKTHDLTDHQLIVRSFLPAITFMWSDWQIPGWPQFFQQRLFPSVPSLVDFKCAIIFRRFHLDFLCANLATPIISYHLISNLQFASQVIHPGNCSPAPSSGSVGFNSPIISQSLVLEFSCACSATPFAQDHLFSKL